MVGILQILTYLLCIYLVFKAVEIFQIALVSQDEKTRPYGLLIGGLAIVISIWLGVTFKTWVDDQANSVQQQLQSIPRP